MVKAVNTTSLIRYLSDLLHQRRGVSTSNLFTTGRRRFRLEGRGSVELLRFVEEVQRQSRPWGIIAPDMP
jgi:hypothetical protein